MTVPQVLPDRKAQQVQTEPKALRELQDRQAHKDCRAFKEQQVLRDRQARRESKDRLVLRVPKVPLVCREWQEMTGPQVLPDRKVQQVQMVLKAHRESQDQLVRKEYRAFKEQQVLRDPRAHKVWQVMMVLPVPLALKGQLELVFQQLPLRTTAFT
jgi:hypothetical protein